MSTRARMLAFLAACCGVGLAVVVLVAGGDEPTPAPKGPPAGERSTPRSSSAPAGVQRRDRQGAERQWAQHRRLRAEHQAPVAQLRSEQPRADGVARGFMEAFLALDAGDRSPNTRGELGRFASPRLVGFLAADRPRLPPGMSAPPRGQVAALDGEFDQPPTRYRARVVVDRGGDASELGIELVRRGRRWTVVSVTE